MASITNACVYGTCECHAPEQRVTPAMQRRINRCRLFAAVEAVSNRAVPVVGQRPLPGIDRRIGEAS